LGEKKSPFEGEGHWDRLSLCSDVTSCNVLICIDD